ncbi:MAG: hypothetical protein J3K34DRAFT_411580 [Monoraphidium minutum]|nr:MAG: hypothetical protein J3K34DRAFT_411580 [Monoraphidium minutum]
MQWEQAVARLERAEMTRRRTGREPTKRAGCCGEAAEVIPQLQDEILDLEQRIEEARRRAWSTNFTPSWFVFFRSQQAAAMAASTQIYGEDTAKFQVHPAPGPEEVNWQHLWLTWRQRDLRSVLTWPLTVAVVVFPITLMTSAVSRLQFLLCPAPGAPLSKPAAALVWPWYCSSSSVLANFIRSLITGWLPALLLNLYLVLALPRLVYLLVQSEGSSFSLSALERRIGVVFFYWDVFNVFLQGIIGSAFFQQVRSIIYDPRNLPLILGAALPDSANFFIQFISMRALFLVWLRMCVPHGGVWQNWCHYLWCPARCCAFCNTDRDKSLTYGPRTPRYGFEMGHVLLIYLLTLTFSVVAPLLLPISVIWFIFAWVQWRHNLAYVYQRKYESGGLMWTYLFSRICICLVIMQLFTFCVLIVKQAYVQSFLIIAFLPALTIKFYRSCQRRFGRGVENVPLELAARAPRAHVPPLVYVPPPLQEKSWGWYPEWNKIWDGWGMPTGYQIPQHNRLVRKDAARALQQLVP